MGASFSANFQDGDSTDRQNARNWAKALGKDEKDNVYDDFWELRHGERGPNDFGETILAFSGDVYDFGWKIFDPKGADGKTRLDRMNNFIEKQATEAQKQVAEEIKAKNILDAYQAGYSAWQAQKDFSNLSGQGVGVAPKVKEVSTNTVSGAKGDL